MALSKQQVAERHFLELRCKVLDIAAALDRIDRAPGEEDVWSQPRFRQLREALSTLLESGPGRAERVQLIFSREYDPQWQSKLVASENA